MAFALPPIRTTALTSALIEPVAALAAFALLWAPVGEGPSAGDRFALLLMLALAFPAPDHLQQPRAERLSDVALNAFMLGSVLLVCAWASGNLAWLDAPRWVAWMAVVPLLQGLCIEGAAAIAARAQARRAPLKVVVVGAGPLARRAARALRRSGSAAGSRLDSSASRRQFMGWFGASPHPGGTGPTRRLGPIEGLHDYVLREQVDEVVLALERSDPAVLTALQDTAAAVYLVPDVVDALVVQGRWVPLGGLPMVALTQSPFTGLWALQKRAMDLLIASLVLALTWPMMIVLALWVRWDSPGPALFRQRRLGLGGREIEVWKFRTMRVMEDGPHVAQATRDDPRVTRLGRWLRRTSLDEWPQFINVLQGRMSIVGPRPHALAHNEFYRHCVPAYMVRHLVRPGITGWAQVHGLRGETDTPDKMCRRIEHDLDYLRRWSPTLDLQIMLRTVGLIWRDTRAW